MAWQDIILLIVLLIGTVKGLLDGFIRQVVSILKWIIAILVGVWAIGSPQYERLVENSYYHCHIPRLAVFILCFILTLLILRVVTSLLDRILDVFPINIVNRILGGASGALVTLVTLSIILQAYAYLVANMGAPPPPKGLQVYPWVEGFAKQLWLHRCYIK